MKCYGARVLGSDFGPNHQWQGLKPLCASNLTTSITTALLQRNSTSYQSINLESFSKNNSQFKSEQSPSDVVVCSLIYTFLKLGGVTHPSFTHTRTQSQQHAETHVSPKPKLCRGV